MIQQRTNLLEDLFETNPEDVSDGEGNIIKMPVTNTKDLNTLVHVVCEKSGVDPDNIKLMLGVDGGQGKLLCTQLCQTTKKTKWVECHKHMSKTGQRVQVSSVAW